MPRLSDGDRAQLCHECDFLQILQDDGIELLPSRNYFTCSLRDEKEPSTRVWEPLKGKLGHLGWTWHDYGSDEKGDALAYLIEHRGLGFVEAVQVLMHTSQFAPEGWKAGPNHSNKRKKTIKRIERYTMPWARQKEAVAGFLHCLDTIDPKAEKTGMEYLLGRGIHTIDNICSVRKLNSRKIAMKVARHLFEENAELYVEAGILQNQEKPLLNWLNPCIILSCRDRQGENDLYLFARQLQGNFKFINQSSQMGAQIVPFGLPMLRKAASLGKKLMVVEAGIDALAAYNLNMLAVATLTRPHRQSFQNTESYLLSDLQACESIDILPDNDDSEKGKNTGVKKAEELAEWLRDHECVSAVSSMFLLDYESYKDLADVTEDRQEKQTLSS